MAIPPYLSEISRISLAFEQVRVRQSDRGLNAWRNPSHFSLNSLVGFNQMRALSDSLEGSKAPVS